MSAMSIVEPLLFPNPELLAPPEDELLVSVVIPCLNEAENIERCVSWALTTLAEHGIPGEVVVADNDSDDGSAALALAAGARVVHERRRGYGNAYMAGFAAARGRHIVMADAMMNGMPLVERLMSNRPAAKVLLVSTGSAERPAVQGASWLPPMRPRGAGHARQATTRG